MRYRAFISYSHADDRWAAWLHRGIEGYSVPRRLRGASGQFGPLPDRVSPLFRDREDLASAGELGPTIRAALAESEALLVVCSPEAARSRWVNEEILEFKRRCGASRIYCLIVAGDPHSGDDRECFPLALRYELDGAGAITDRRVEPIAADVRPGKDGKALARLKLLSGLLGVDLDRLRQREAQRRQRRLLAITGVALVVMIITSALAVQAVIARKDAERRQKQAENLVTFMLGDLYDKLQQVQRLDIMAAVNDQAMKYFESLPTTDVTDEVLAQRTKALEKIGSVRLDQGSVEAAAASYRAALPLAAHLAASFPADPERQAAYARMLTYLGMTDWYQGNLDPALGQFESAEQVLQAARRHDARDPLLLTRLTEVENNIGHILESRGDLTGAAARYASMLSLAQTLVNAHPDDPDAAVSLGLAHNNLGKLALMRGDLATAIAEYSADDRIETEIARRNPKDNNQSEKVAITRATLGRTLALAGDSATGRAHLAEAVAIVTRLGQIDPSISSFREDLGLYATQLARLHRQDGDLDGAMALTVRALDTFEALTREDPANAVFRREQAETKLERAEQLHAAGQHPAARALAGDAAAMLEPMLAEQPGDRALVLAVAGVRSLLARLSSGDDAAGPYREVLSLVDRVQDGKSDPRLLMLKVESLLALGRRREADPVIQELWRAGCRDAGFLSVLARVGVDYPDNPEFDARLLAALKGTSPAPSADGPAAAASMDANTKQQE